MTMQDTATTSVREAIVVEAPAERAFKVFTEDIASWWPPDHHVIESPLAEMVLELRPGGRVYDRGTDGSECQWGTVLAYEPPERFVFSWNINLAWGIEDDPAKSSEVEVRFIPQGPERTRVELEHRHLDRHGPGWKSLHEGVDGDAGWPLYLARYAELVAGDR